ncbi:MAG TPA: acyl-ACP--UDP-N-acetylglucosamine O-acyltransferase [Planctomycetota bacterium]|nr:acyl-ACP--UDP-N-acetylglucosamine O-acyltransferase [Planctomycetota bacterium]
MGIHATAIVDPGARLAADVEVGPYAVIGKDVAIGARTRVGPHANVMGPLEMGEDNIVGFSAAIGLDPQVKGRTGPWGATRIGSRNVFREFSQVHRSMKPDGCTVVGDDCYLMATSHVGHDSVIGNHVVLCNGVLLSGHVEVGDRVFLSGNAGVHQFARVGELVMVAGLTGISRDVPPYCMVVGFRPRTLTGLNRVGLKRAGIPAESIDALKDAFRALFRTQGPLEERLALVRRGAPEVEKLLAFVLNSRRGVIGLAAGADAEER